MILRAAVIPMIVCLDEAAPKHHLSIDLVELQAMQLPELKAQIPRKMLTIFFRYLSQNTGTWLDTN